MRWKTGRTISAEFFKRHVGIRFTQLTSGHINFRGAMGAIHLNAQLIFSVREDKKRESLVDAIVVTLNVFYYYAP